MPHVHDGVRHLPLDQEEHSEHRQEQKVHGEVICERVRRDVRLFAAVKMGAGEYEHHSRRDQHQRAHPVHRSFFSLPLDFVLAANHGYRRGYREDAERHECQKYHAPAHELEQNTEEGEADQSSEPGPDNRNRERPPALVWPKVCREYRVGVAHDQSRAKSCHSAPQHDLPEFLGKGDQRRADGGEDDADKEDSRMAVTVAESRAQA